MRREFWVGLLLIAVYLVLASATTQILHFSQALDEGYHLEYVTFIRQNGRLPISYEERAQITRADFPPLYQLLVVALSAGIPLTEQPDFKYYYDSFRYRAVDMLTDHPGTFRTEDLSPPYLGRFLVWQIGRWLSVGLSLTTLVVIFLTMQALPLGQRPLTSVAGAAIIAFTPRFLILSSSLNDDNLLGLVAALYFWALVQVIKLPTKWWPVLLLGLFLGVSMTVKYTLVLVPLEILLVMGGLVYWRQLGWRWAIQRMVVIALLAVLFSSWWFGWNIGHMNTIA
jgi:4-amino-4-deoxy-L-arabinose transferase-like glycosyltransferase